MIGPLHGLNSGQKTQLLSDTIHASVVTFVVLCATFLAGASTGLPKDVIGAVFGGAIGYAAGRAGNVQRGSTTTGGRRETDTDE